jgi:hypothetical protein
MPPWPVYADDEIEAVGRVLRSGQANYWSGGEGRALEQELAGLVGVSHGLALANGSLALEAALLALEIGRGDEVVVTPRSFIASASAVVLRGARPVFADVDRDSGNLRADAIGAVLSDRTRAVLVVHLGGWPCDMDAILALAARCRLAVIEDCAQALGARYRGRAVGSFGSVAAYSFCQDKILSSGGEGGMLVSRDSVLWGRAWSARDHGANRTGLEDPDGRPGFRWYRSTFGSNWRMTEMQAAIARRQLVKLPDWLQTRRKNLALAIEGLADVPGLRVPRIPAQVEHAGYRYYLYVRPERLRPGWTRDRILCALAAEGVPGLSGTCPEIYRERAFADAGLGPASPLPVARELGETSLALLLHPGLSAGDMDDQIQALRKVMTVASAERTA